MTLPRLHASAGSRICRWDDPQPPFQIDLRPKCASCLAGSNCGENQELKDELGCVHGWALAEVPHEGWNDLPCQGRMMSDLSVIGAKFACNTDARVGTLAGSAQDGAVEYGLHALQDAGRRLGLGKPDWLQHSEDLGSSHLGDRPAPNVR